MKLSRLLDEISPLEVHTCGDAEISDICFDSRACKKGSLFVAVRGYKTDGHKYIEKAVENGASAVIAEEKPVCPVPWARVENSRRALASASAAFYGHPEKRLKIVGVTGTNGKTTVTNLIKTVLESCGEKCGLIGTNGNMIGSRMLYTERTTPESKDLYALLKEMADEGCTYAVMEVSSHSLALDRVWGLEFESAVFTNLTQDHLDFHATMDDYARAKSILFDRCRKAVVNSDDAYCGVMLERCRRSKMTYSAKDPGADAFANDIELGQQGVSFNLVFAGGNFPVYLGIPGMFSVYNALAALGCCISLGIDPDDVVSALKSAHGVKGRAQVVPVNADYTVMLDYAHTPDGVENILKAARGFARGRVVALFGCGGDRDKTKRPIMGKAAGSLADFCIVTSDNPRSENPGDIINDILPGVMETSCPYVVIEDRREAIRYALQNGRKDDVIVLMGKGHEDYQEINGVRHHLDEYEEVMKFFGM